MSDDQSGGRQNKAWLLPLAICIVSLLAAPAVFAWGWLFQCLITFAGISALICAYIALKPLVLRSRDKYDLRQLRELHEHEELIAAGDELPSEQADTIVCPNCGSPYHHRFPICPNCRR